MTPSEISGTLTSIRSLVEHSPEQARDSLLAIAPDLLRSEQVLTGADIIRVLSKNEHNLPRRRLAILGDVTVNAIAAAAVVRLFAEKILAETYIAPYGTINQEILNPDSEFYRFKPDIALIVPCPDVENDIAIGDNEGAIRKVSESIGFWHNAWNIIAERLPNVRIIQHLYELPEEEFSGIAEQRVSWSTLRITMDINKGLISGAPPFVHFIDMDRLAARVGKNSWRDPRLWFLGKVPFAPRHMDHYSMALGGALRRATGKNRKALIVDLDNTLWGGVVGDDGYEGIRIGPGDPVGEAYADFCNYIKTLGTRGIILGICSKNNPEIALKVFEINPYMPLKRENFAIIRCNWDDKATNLRAIASELNIDLSAIVFADDNPAECELIQKELPAVTVIHLKGDPAGFRRQVDSLHLFELDSISHEDLSRTASYQGRKMADIEKTSSASLEDYLAGLKMDGLIWDARDDDLPRLSQMENKTNQFNVTTKRWSADQLHHFMRSGNHDIICFRLIDKFADHGLVSSLVVRYQNNSAHILSWLMSCRVLSRTAEEFIINDLVERARSRHVSEIIGEYIPTEKNVIVSDLYKRLGFTPGNHSEGLYHLNLQHSEQLRTFIKKSHKK
jgi:FkbH-like protein